MHTCLCASFLFIYIHISCRNIQLFKIFATFRKILKHKNKFISTPLFFEKRFNPTKMKKIIKIFLLLFVALSTSMCVSHRTVVVQDPVMPPPPMWGPAGFDGIRYYYMPDMMVYYDLHTGMFIYPRGRRWITRNYLPGYYSHFDLYNTHVVVINNYFGPSPYQYFNQHRVTYPVGFRGPAYQTIGRRGQDSRNYFAPNRGTSAQGGRNSTAQGGRGDATGSGRQSIENSGGGRGSGAAVPSDGRGSSGSGVNAGGRGQNATETNSSGRNNTATVPSGGRGQEASETSASGRNSGATNQGGRSQTMTPNTTSSGTRTSSTSSTRSETPAQVAPPRMTQQDAQAAQQRTRQIKQTKPTPSRSQQAAPAPSSGGRSSTPAPSTSGGGRRG